MRRADHSSRGVLPSVCVCARLRYREASKMRRPYPTGACCALEGDVAECVLSRVASARCALFLCHRVAK